MRHPSRFLGAALLCACAPAVAVDVAPAEPEVIVDIAVPPPPAAPVEGSALGTPWPSTHMNVCDIAYVASSGPRSYWSQTGAITQCYK